MNYVPLSAEGVELHQRRVERAEQGEDLMMPDELDVPVGLMMENVQHLECYEKHLASPTLALSGYRDGVATQPDEVFVRQRPDSSTLISTEHATFHYRLPKNRTTRITLEPETGIAGLAGQVAAELGGTHATILGRQTSDANHDLNHPFKDRLLELLADGSIKTFVSLHGMTAAHTTDLQAERSLDVVVGVGNRPNRATLLTAYKIMKVCEKYGLLAGINPKFIKMRKRPDGLEVRQDDEGNPITTSFAAAREITTRSMAEGQALAQMQEKAAVQVELSSNLRLKELEVHRSWKPTYVGTYIGYQLLVEALG